MEVIIKTHHVKVTKSLKEYAEKKVEKLSRFFEHIQEIVVDLDVASASNENEQQIASATIFASGTIIRASESSKTMYASIDGLVDKLEVQLKKHKEKVTEHKRGAKLHPQAKGKQKVLTPSHEPRFVPKPMGVEDAAALLQQEGLSFLAFRNLKERICIVYPLGKDEVGLIEI